MSYVFNFVVKIRLVLTYDLRSVDQAMNHSPFYVIRVVGLEVEITTSKSKIPVHFCGQFWTPLLNQNVKEWVLLASTSTVNLMVGLIS
jgi:hypothetical protein